jgi:hypothetical protein
MCGGMNDESVILPQSGNPALDIGGGIPIGVLVGNLSDGAEKRRAHLGYEFFLAVEFVPEVSSKGAIEPTFVACAVD